MKPHPFRDMNPKHLDCGDLVDAETGEYMRPATADEARRSIRAQRFEGSFQGVFAMQDSGNDPVLVRVVQEHLSLADWRLAVALKLRWEREVDRQIEKRMRGQ